MKNPLITMSAIVGRPDRNDIYSYLFSLKENGIEQALIYPRSGCEIPYLSEEWFSTVADYIECASELDMSLWLYDDFNWPSGDAGGRVTANKDYRLKSIATKGEDAGRISCKSRHNSDLFGEKYFPDLLSEDAVEYFISCTHEEYYNRFGNYFGTVIKGIFTDEPSIGYCCTEASIPYYNGIEKDYTDLCGGDFYYDMKNNADGFYVNAISVISERFNSCYVKKLVRWCKNHDILMTGHLLCDNDPCYATRHSGNYLKNLSSFSLPGIDDIYTSFSSQDEMAILGAAEYASGENGAMAELFALGPVDMSYAKKRCMLYLAAAFKINHYFLAISHMDMRGNLLIKDYFNTFSIDQPDFCGMKLLSKDAELAAEYASLDFQADAYIRYPFKECAKRVAGKLDSSPIWKVINELTGNGVQWKLINDEHPTDAPIIEFDSELKPTFDYSKIQGKITIKDKNGDTPSGIFTRIFKNDVVLILNLYAPSGIYNINGQNVFLSEYDVKLNITEDNYVRKELCADFTVRYQNDNIIRAMLLNDTDTSNIECDMDTNVRLAIRNGTEAYLNGNKIECTGDADILPHGFNTLYKISDTVSLKKGLSILKSEKDFKYLPSTFILGNFCAEAISGDICNVKLTPRKDIYSLGDSLIDYGRVEFTAEVTAPENAKEIEIYGTDLYTEVYANDTLIGKSIASPYAFKIDKGLQGKKVLLKIVQLSSIGNIFGDTDYWDKNSTSSQWQGTPSTHKTSFGFDKINWVIK